MSTPLLSLVVLGFRNFDVTTRACLDSLVPWLDDSEIEVLVVDNGSPDDSAQKTLQWCAAHPQTKCLLSDTNRGYAGGMNWGAAQASGQWLLLVNNDTVFPAMTLDALKKVICEAPSDVAMLGPVTNAAGNGQRLWKPEASVHDWMQIGAWLNQHPTEHLLPVYRCDFFTIAIRRDVWDQLGGLDLAFGLGYYEDFDFSLRLRAAGYRQLMTEDVFILHMGSATFQHSKATRTLIKKNKRLLLSKHPNVIFENTRLANLDIVKKYIKIKKEGQWSNALEYRYEMRRNALKEDKPRSWLKRLRWIIKICRTMKDFT